MSVISPPAPPSSTTYQGCYTDDGLRALPVELMSYGATVETCTEAARAQGLKYAGLQYYGYCFGGNALQYEKVSDPGRRARARGTRTTSTWTTSGCRER